MENFLLLATVYLVTMVIAVPLSARLGLGSVLGYLGAGIVIGPILGLTGGNVYELQHFAEFGVVMMLFLIGLELEPQSLWNMRHKMLGLGGAQIGLTIAAITAIAMLVGQPFPMALTIGMIMSLSSTAIVLQTLSEKNLMPTAGGRSAFAVLLTQDIAVIPMLALMPLLAMYGGRPIAEGGAHGAEAHIGDAAMASLPGWAAALATLTAMVLIVVLGQYLIRPIFRYVHVVRLREMDTALALLIVVGIASLMILVGLSPALGTFLAGVMLAGSEFRHELETQIEPFKGLLLGVFFITVGAGMDFAMLFAQPLRIVLITAGLIAVKAIVLNLVARRMDMTAKDRTLFTLSLAQTGEFGFVLISYAVSLAIIPDAMARGFLLIIGLSMLATPLLFILNDRVARRISESATQLHDPDEIEEQQPIIIAGMGRFGQVVNRLVTLSGFSTIVLDHDLKLIQLMRRFGFKGYFGDPTRPEILAAAGLDKAQILVAALGDPAANVKLVKYAREQRPDLRIIARARDRVIVYQLYAAGADHIVREMFDSSLRAGRYVLENAGLTEYEASELEKIFYRLDRASLRELAEVWEPDIPLDENKVYLQRARDLNRALENALMQRFSEGPSAAPLDGEDPSAEADPAQGPKMSARTGTRSA